MAEVSDQVALEIRKRPGVCGGRARIGDTRIPVWSLVIFKRRGVSDDQLLQFYPGLTLEHLRLAWEYYDSHREEIDRDIKQQEQDERASPNG
jgi:uncharacterized protein (DUF433 family)